MTTLELAQKISDDYLQDKDSDLYRLASEVLRLSKLIDDTAEIIIKREEELERAETAASIHADEHRRLRAEVEDYKNGVLNFRCPSCKSIAGPLYPVNLAHEIEELKGAVTEASRMFKDIKEHSARPFVGNKWNNYALDVCNEWLAKYPEEK